MKLCDSGKKELLLRVCVDSLYNDGEKLESGRIVCVYVWSRRCLLRPGAASSLFRTSTCFLDGHYRVPGLEHSS